MRYGIALTLNLRNTLRPYGWTFMTVATLKENIDAITDNSSDHAKCPVKVSPKSKASAAGMRRPICMDA